MKLPRMEIPTLQNWSCHGCSACCRGQLLIAVSLEEKLRIEKQGWTAATCCSSSRRGGTVTVTATALDHPGNTGMLTATK